MTIRPDHVHAARAVTVWIIRAVAITAIAFSLYLIAARLVFGFMTGDPSAAWKVWSNVAQDHGVVRGIPMLAIGIALAAASTRLARWIITMPDTGCPRCGYADATADTCPECGLKLAATETAAA